MFCDEALRWYLTALLTTKYTAFILKILNPTLTFNIENIAAIPVIVDRGRKEIIDGIAKQCVVDARFDWDAYETSWDFKRNPLV